MQGAEFISNYWADVYDFNREFMTKAEQLEYLNAGWRCAENQNMNYYAQFDLTNVYYYTVAYCYNPDNMEEFVCQMPIEGG